MLEFLRAQLAKLLEERAALKAGLDKVLEAPQAEQRGLTDEEAKAFAERRDAIKAKDEEISQVEARIAELEEIEKRSQRANELQARYGQPGPATPSGVRVVSEPLTYERGNGRSYFLDLARAQVLNDAEARERLMRHAREVEVELPKRERLREQRAQQELRTIPGLPEDRHGSVFERRALDRTDGTGGYFVPPLWLIDEYIDLPRWGRPLANAVRNLTLPGGTDSINLPRIKTGTKTDVQTADGAPVASQDLTDDFVNAPVRTIAGQQDMSIQLLEQSPVGFDEIVFADLIADYNQRLDLQVINGSGTAGQVLGILNVSGINAITYTDADPTLPEMWVPWVQSVSQIASRRKMPATATFVTPGIWFWACSQLDTTNRPLIIPSQDGAVNPMALQTGADAEGPVGRLTVGTPVILDGNIPSNLGAGTNETRIITLRTSDLYLWEGSMRTRVLQEVLSGTLQVRLQVYNYVAFMPNRRPEAISVVSGTGMVPPAGF